jgi:hypothetical protein
MATSPNFGWLEPDNTDLVKNGALAIRTAVNAIDASMAELKGGTTGQVLSKTSNTDMDFTWVAQDDSNAIQNAIVDAKGDLIGATAADTPARLGVGTNGQVLTADSTAATGLAWATPSSGGGMTLLSTTSLSGATTTISSISQSYKTLFVIVVAMTNSTADGRFRVAWNTDKYFFMSGTSNSTAYQIDNSFLSPNVNTSRTETNNAFALEINNYTDGTNGMKPVQAYGFTGSSSTSFNLGGSAFNASALTSLSFSNTGGNWSGGTVYIYGVA